VWFSDEFTLTGGDNIAIDLSATVSNSWVSVGGDLIEANGVGFEMFDRDIEYYFGYEDGESWTEGSQHETVMLPAQKAGTYVLRLEASTPGGSPPPIDVRVRQDVFANRMALYALIAVFAPALILVILSYSFERRRWRDSTMAPSIYTIRAGGDDE
jgi:hypothetical protein